MNSTSLLLAVLVAGVAAAVVLGGKGTSEPEEQADPGFSWLPNCGGLVISDVTTALLSAHDFGRTLFFPFARNKLLPTFLDKNIFKDACTREQLATAMASNPTVARIFYEMLRAMCQGQMEKYPKNKPLAFAPFLAAWRNAFTKAGVDITGWPTEVGTWAGPVLP